MTVRGIDYSFGRPGGKAIAAAGFRFVIRYVPYPGAGGKGLTAAERDNLHANGLGICLVFESYAGRALAGKTAGATDSGVALANARPLGWPEDRPIYFAVDRNITYRDQFIAVDDYFRGLAAALPVKRIGAYAETDVLTRLRDQGLATYFWQTAATAWSAGKVAEFAHIRQGPNGQTLNGAAVDYDTAYITDYGQWLPLPDTSTEGDMAPFIPKDELWTVKVGAQYLDAPNGSALGKFSVEGPFHTLGAAAKADGSTDFGWRLGVITHTGGSATLGWINRNDLVTVTPFVQPADCSDAVAQQKATDDAALATYKAGEATRTKQAIADAFANATVKHVIVPGA